MQDDTGPREPTLAIPVGPVFRQWLWRRDTNEEPSGAELSEILREEPRRVVPVPVRLARALDEYAQTMHRDGPPNEKRSASALRRTLRDLRPKWATPQEHATLEHPDCDECRALVTSARTYVRVTGSLQSTYTVEHGGTRHAATWEREF